MTNDGILIIEDVQSWDWIDVLINETPDHLKEFIKIYGYKFEGICDSWYDRVSVFE